MATLAIGITAVIILGSSSLWYLFRGNEKTEREIEMDTQVNEALHFIRGEEYETPSPEWLYDGND